MAVLILYARTKPGREVMVQAIRFRNTLADRHPTCTVGEAWKLASFTSYDAAFKEIGSSLKTIRADGPLSLVQTPYGELWMPSRDLDAAPEMFLDQQAGIYQPDGNGVRTGDIVLDCGANIGVYTKYALSKGARRVVAIEVAPEDIECLRRNLTREIESGSVTLYPKGVWDSETTMDLHSSPDFSSMANSVALNLNNPGGNTIVPLTTIDKIAGELNLPRVDFIKMDIEGAEANALKGGGKTLERFKPRLAIALEHRKSDPDTLPQLVRSNWPSYQTELSECAIKGGGFHIQPNVLYAHPR
jgi:FkbM family methyltransferase